MRRSAQRRYNRLPMKRLALFLTIGVIAVIALAYALRLSRQPSATKVTSLLPQDTIAFVHVPDFNRTRDEWRRSDIYQLIHEPAVEQLLRKPLDRLQKRNSQAPIFHDLEQVGAKDIFIAVTSIAARNGSFIAGFRFRGNREAAAAIINKWQAQFLKKNANAKEEKIAYGQHQIEVAVAPTFTLATTYDGQWFFASNEIDRLKELLDRADGREETRNLPEDKIDNHPSSRATPFAQRWLTCPRITPRSSICSRKRSPIDLRQSAPRTFKLLPPMRRRCAG